MGVSRRDAEELLGAWAVDAVDTDERAAIDAILATDAVLDRRGAAMLAAAASLSGGVEVAPPPELRDRVLAEATGHPRSPVATPPVELYRGQAADLVRLARSLASSEWQVPVAPYDWTVHGLVAHLVAIDRLMAGLLGLVDLPDHAEAGHLEVGSDLVVAELARDPAETLAEWERLVELVASHLDSVDGPGLDDPMPLHGWPFHVASLLTARAFEMWTHADDIRRATGRPPVTPPSPDVHAMSDFSVRSLPLVLPLMDEAGPVGPVRVVLTGTGGGTWDLDGGADVAPALVIADAVSYCRVAARRLDAADLEVAVDGDADVAASLLVAARVFAV